MQLSFSQQQKTAQSEWVDYRQLTQMFMENLKVRSSFMLNDKNYFVKSIGKWKSELFEEVFKTVTIVCVESGKQIKFYYFFGYGGNPSKKDSTRKGNAPQYNFVRNVEGTIVVDLLNANNPFHEMSDIYKLATIN